jgi:ribosomal protein S12 methylthiotransferase accessory factor
MVDWLRCSAAELRARLGDTVLSSRSTVALGDLPTADIGPGSAEAVPLVLDRLAAEGFSEVLVADLAPGDGSLDDSGVAAVKVLVPGLEVETMSYGRIGERNLRRLIEAGRDDLAWVGAPRPGASRVHLTEQAEERLGGHGWLDRAALDGVVDGLYPLYREPSRHAAPLALGREERA